MFRRTKSIRAGLFLLLLAGAPVSSAWDEVGRHEGQDARRELRRSLAAIPVADGARFMLSEDALAMAWASRAARFRRSLQATVTGRGTVEVDRDGDEIAVLLIDSAQQVSGFARADKENEVVELVMTPTASYGGTLVDRRDGSPLADYTLQMAILSSNLAVCSSQRTDERGRFAFPHVPAGVPLWLQVDRQGDDLGPYIVGGARMFEPGEQREKDIVAAAWIGEVATTAKQPPQPPTKTRVANVAETSRAMGMPVVIFLEGDDSHEVKRVVASLLDSMEVEEIVPYLPLVVSATEQLAEPGIFTALGAPRSQEREIVMLVLRNGQEGPATLKLDCTEADSAIRRGSEFLDRHRPPAQDARVKLEDARVRARSNGRSVWVILGGTRCGPCYRLARWVDQNREILERDLVIVKVTNGLDEHFPEIERELGGSRHGIPYHVLLSPEGEILWSSESPLGNIGMPSSVEGIRHFRRMLHTARTRLTQSDIDALIDSLSSGLGR
jgi:hypothetical protein